MKAIQLVMQYLERSFANANDMVAREKMHNASCIAELAFTNAFLGISHSLAHKLGGEFHIAHGRANAILLPHVIRYNATKPTKFTIFPKYSEFIADQRYAEIARFSGLQGNTTEELVTALIEKIRDMNRKLGIPETLKDTGIDETEFFAVIRKMSENAFEDQCTGANPRYPLISELEDIYRRAYYGDFV